MLHLNILFLVGDESHHNTTNNGILQGFQHLVAGPTFLLPLLLRRGIGVAVTVGAWNDSSSFDMLLVDDLLQSQADTLKEKDNDELFDEGDAEQNCNTSIKKIERFFVSESAEDRVDESYLLISELALPNQEEVGS